MSLQDVRNGYRSAIKSQHPNFNVYSSAQLVTQVPAVIIKPASDIETPAGEYRRNYGGSVLWMLDVMVLLPLTDIESSQRKMDDLISPDVPGNLMQCLNTRNSSELADAVDYVLIKQVRNYGGVYSEMDIDHIGLVLKTEAEEPCNDIV